MVIVTEKASEKIRDLMEKENKKEGSALRVVAEPGGCAGVKFQLVFDDTVTDHDVKQDQNGLPVVYEKGMEAFVKSLEIDYVEGLDQTGFVMKNADAKNSCGCGKSHGF
jgi:iron-sulfur cluster assembly accessory protein